MTNRSFVLSVITSSILLAFFALSNLIGQPQIAFVIVSALLFGFSLYSKLAGRNKHLIHPPSVTQSFQSAGQK
jgi:hypothetical protein